ncbi:hypothetical protein FLONG3_2077 [Fusarium longipes]|uniref:Uncharacterized protein n=1 Tax=Fusarium longipes TaxID=694270 RepID=A0A395T4U9_9HYPO|nr:hypothetical protein FLONG3_2077 [Fusarium longipes]
MQFKTLFTASLLSGAAFAAPKATCTSEAKTESSPIPKTFGLVALRSASPIHFASFSASESGFQLKLPKGDQHAKCVGGKDDGTATFRISKAHELFLYNTGKEQQIAYTDRSGMGQGVLQYTSSKSYPRNAETEGWKIDKSGNLVFGSNNASFVACPGQKESDPWSVWVATGTSHPGNSDKECLGFNARVAEIKKATSCVYTEYSN